MGRPPHHRARGAAIQPWPSSRWTRPPRGDHAALSARARGPHAAPATRGRAPRACRSRRGPGGRGAPRADAGYSAAQARARAARDEHIAFAVGARRIAGYGGCRTAPPGTAGASRPAWTPPWPPWRITGQAGGRRIRRCCSARPRAGLLTGRCG